MAAIMTTAERLAALLDHLALGAAHVATQMPADAAGFAECYPERIGGLVLCVPTRLDPAPFVGVAGRLLMISGDAGLTVAATVRAAERLPSAQRHVLAGYDAAGWSDVVADRTAELAGAMARFLSGRPGAPPAANIPASTGAHAGLTYRIEGQGPPLLLLPFFLAPSQWQPALPELCRHFTVIRVGGPQIGGVAALEDRARAPTYQGMFRNLIDQLAPTPESRILDVGCGSGALDRLLAERLGPAARIDAVDVNPFFLSEAAALADAADLGQRIRFGVGSAVELPFADNTFDCVYSVTVLEECDAGRAIAEMVRVAKPGGRVGVVVRAIDVAQWWNLDLPEPLRARTASPPQSVGPGGVADASLYARMLNAGLVDLAAFPALITLEQPDGPIWRYREDAVLQQLSATETEQWQMARAAASQAGVLMQANVLHCAVARKPESR